MIFDCLSIGLSGISDAVSSLSSNEISYASVNESNREEFRTKNRQKAIDAKRKAKEARMKMNRSIWQGPKSNAYIEYVGMIEDAKNDPIAYPKNRIEQIQRNMEQLRNDADIPKHENEDWGKN